MKMKRFLALVLSLLMLVSLVPASLVSLIVAAEELVVKTVYVNGQYTGDDSDGSAEKPFLNLNTAFYYLSTVSGVDEAVILVAGDTPLAETVRAKAELGGSARYFLQSFASMSGGKKMTNMLQLPALSFPVIIRGTGGNLTQKVESPTDLADPALLASNNITQLKEAHLIVNIKSELIFDNIRIDAVYDKITLKCVNATTVTFEDDFETSGVNAANFNLEFSKLSNTLHLNGGTFSTVVMDMATAESSGSSTVVNIGSNAQVYTFIGCAKTESAVLNITGGYIGEMYVAGKVQGAIGNREINISGGTIDEFYLGAFAENGSNSISTANYTLNLSGGELGLSSVTGGTGDASTACTGNKTVNAYDGYEYAITESALPGYDNRNEHRADPPEEGGKPVILFVGEGGNDANSGLTEALRMKTFEKAVNRAISLYKRGIASSVTIQIVGTVVLDSKKTNYVSPEYSFSLKVRGGTIVTNSNSTVKHHYAGSSTGFDFIMQGPIVWQNVAFSAPNYRAIVLFAQKYHDDMTASPFDDAFEMTVDGASFSNDIVYIYGGRNADLYVKNTTVQNIMGGKNLYLTNTKVTNWFTANAPYGVGVDEVNIVLRNSITNVAFGAYKRTANKITLRLEKGSDVTGYSRASYSSGGTTNSYVEEYTVIFAGGSHSGSLEGKGDAYYRNEGSASGETTISKVIVEGNLGVKYAPKESAAIDFDSYEVIGYIENLQETVYVDPTFVGESDGTKAKPFTTMDDAFLNFNKLGEGGTIVLLADATVSTDDSAIYNTYSFDGNVTITGNKKASLIVEGEGDAVILSLNGPVEFKNITLDTVSSENDESKPELAILANGNALTMGAGCTLAAPTMLVGGAMSDEVDSTSLTVLSGSYVGIIGGGIMGTVSGNTSILLNGANVSILVGGGSIGDVGGSANIVIEKGTVENLFAGNISGGTTFSSTILLRNKNAVVTDLLSAKLLDGETNGVVTSTELAKLGASKIPADAYVLGITKIVTTTQLDVYVNGSTKITNGDGTKAKPFSSILNALDYISNYEKSASSLYSGTNIHLTGRTEMAEIRLNKLNDNVKGKVTVKVSTNATTGQVTLNSTITTPQVSKPVTVIGSSRGVLATDALTKYEMADSSVVKCDIERRTYSPSVNFIYKNVHWDNSCNRFSYYPPAGYSTYFTSTFTSTASSIYVRHAGGVGTKMNVFGGTFSYVCAGLNGYAELIVGGDATKISGHVSGAYTPSNFDILIEILGGMVSAVYGGTWTGSGTHNGNVKITVVGGRIGRVNGGSVVDSTLNGKVVVSLGGGEITGLLDGYAKTGGNVSGSRTLRYTVDYALKARSATNFTNIRMVDRVVATGDSGALIIWASVLVVTLILGSALIVLGKRHKRQRV